MRILYLQPAAECGGAERQAAELVRRLPRLGIEVVPVVGPGRAICDFLDDGGVRDYLHRADLPADVHAPRSLAGRARLLGDYVRAYLRLVEELTVEARARRCELLYASRPFAWVVAGEIGERLGRPVVWRAGTLFEHWAQPPALRFASRRRPPRACVYTSEAVRRTLEPCIDAPAFVLHNGVDTERFSVERVEQAGRTLRGSLGVAEGAPVAALVARLAPEKGLDAIVDVGRRLAARRPDARLLVAGDSGYRPLVERALREAGLGDVVRLLGYVRDVERVYAAADVVLSISRSEGCPNTLLEAMAMERPIVAARVGGTVEIARDREHGRLVAPGDAGALVDAAVALLDDEPRRRALGRAARRHVETRFSVETQAARLASILRWAASDEAAPRHGEAA